jgi:FkbM family methyltransferase
MIIGFDQYQHRYNFKVSGIIHVGAHYGQEWQEYQDYFGEVATHWFEPLPDVYKILKENLNNKPKTYFYNMALGSQTGQTQMYVSSNEGQSSSILKPKTHQVNFPDINFDIQNPVRVSIQTLDNLDIRDANMLVLDTQGYELEVLRGAIDTLHRIEHFFTEFQTSELYEGSESYLEKIDEFLEPYNLKREQTWYAGGDWGDAYYRKVGI